jgi:hypothetical protein
MSKLCIIQYNKYNLQERDKYPRIFFINNNKKLRQANFKKVETSQL